MIKFYRDASTRYVSVHVTKWFGVKLEPCLDGDRRLGLLVFGWYPKNRQRLKHWSLWVRTPFKK
jgi:hypothetical protein